LKKYEIPPNFFCSDEFFHRSNIEEVEQNGYVYWEGDNWIVCPPIEEKTGKLIDSREFEFKNGIWSSFQNWNPSIDCKKSFLDFEYLYNPRDFLDLSGGKWQVFRKNIKKFPGRYGKSPLKYEIPNRLIDKKGTVFVIAQINDLLISWLEGNPGRNVIEDAEVLHNFILNGDNRKILIDKDLNILGVNVWDYNYRYINFRFSICRPYKFLSEYLKYLFYTDPIIYYANTIVNDGGTMGNENLEKFKNKLNPVERLQLFTYSEGENEKRGVIVGH
jgi:hypothetical protein